MQKKGHIVAIMLSVFILSGCDVVYEATVQPWVKPKPWGMAKVPEGTPEFQMGWKDGCETGMDAYGNDRYKVAYSWKQDINLVENDEYMEAWSLGYFYCRRYVQNWVRAWRQ